MSEHDDAPETLVVVKRAYGERHTATFRLEEFEITPGSLRLDGFVHCDAALDGAVDHSCKHGLAPHRIRVSVMLKDNAPAVFAALVRQALAREEGH